MKRTTTYLMAAVAAVLGLIGFAVAGGIDGLLVAAPMVAIDSAMVEKELKRIGDEVQTFIGAYTARLITAEQTIAGIDAHSSLRGVAGGPGVGAQVLQEFNDTENEQFKAAVLAAQRGGNPSAFAARANLGSSIRTALTNDGAGTTADGGIASRPERSGIVGPVARPLRLLDVLPSRPTSSDAVEFVQLSVTGDASEQDQEGAEKAELDFDGTLARAEIATIAGWTAASKQVLADHNALQAQIDRVIRSKVLSRLEHQIINGAGTAGKINGLLTQATVFVPTIGTAPADVIGEALVRQANNGYTPNLVLLNPFDWYAIQITKTNTEGEYIFGSPTMPVPPSLWNTAVVVTPSVAEGTGLTIDTSFVTVLDREQLSVTVSNSHSDFFTRNLVAILGELRAGLEVLDAWAVYKFDLNASE